MILSDIDIRDRLLWKGPMALVVDGLEDLDLQVQPCSIDLRLDRDALLMPMQFVLASTIERVEIPADLLGRVCGRSTIGRMGVQVENAGLIDPGFKGQITLELFCCARQPVNVLRGTRICQLTLEELRTPAARPYGHPSRRSKYQGQIGATPAVPDQESS